MKILITGASGFIGQYLVNEACNKGYQVWAGVRATSSLKHLPAGVQTIDLQYNNPQALLKQLQDFCNVNGGPWDYVIHNAGITKTPRKSDFELVNATYTKQLIKALTEANCKPQKFLLMSSLSSYGRGDEKNFTPIQLDDKQCPDTLYGQSKLNAELYLKQQSEIPYIILRPTGVYGPGDKDYLMAIQSVDSGFDFAAGFKPQHITFIYVKDLARAALVALENKNLINKHYFVADGDVYTDTQFTQLIQQQLHKKRMIRVRVPLWIVYCACVCSELIGKISGKAMTLNTDKFKILKQRNWVCQTEPLYNELPFKPAYNLKQGLQETINWYLNEK